MQPIGPADSPIAPLVTAEGFDTRFAALDYSWLDTVPGEGLSLPDAMDVEAGSLPDLAVNPDLWTKFLQDLEIPAGFFVHGATDPTTSNDGFDENFP
jgi:hypothetical protein